MKRARRPTAARPAVSLRPIDAATTGLVAEQSLEDVAIAGTTEPELHVPMLTIVESSVGASFAEARLPSLHLRDCRVEDADWANVQARGAAVHNSEMRRVRLTGAMLAEASLRDVTFDEVRADLVSFSDAKLNRVAFNDCVLDESSFDQAQLQDVTFERCRLVGATFARARLSRVELIDCDITHVRGVADLRGAMMRVDDVLANAIALAGAAGIGIIPAEE